MPDHTNRTIWIQFHCVRCVCVCVYVCVGKICWYSYIFRFCRFYSFERQPLDMESTWVAICYWILDEMGYCVSVLLVTVSNKKKIEEEECSLGKWMEEIMYLMLWHDFSLVANINRTNWEWESTAKWCEMFVSEINEIPVWLNVVCYNALNSFWDHGLCSMLFSQIGRRPDNINE